MNHALLWRSCLCFVSAFAITAHAATVTVTTGFDVVDGNTSSVAAINATPGGAGISLREAVLAVNNDATSGHIINVPAGTYTLSIAGLDDTAAAGDLDVKKAVTITGAGSASTIIRGGTNATNGVDKIFSMNPLGNTPGFAVTMSGVTLRFGRNVDTATSPGNNIGGAMDFDAGFGANFNGQGALTLTDVVFDQNSTVNGNGGALAFFDGGTANITNCSFTNNRASSNAGASVAGGGIAVGFSNNATSYILTNCTIDGNATTGTTPGVGGGIYCVTRGLILRGCTITNNTAGGGNDGGGIFTSPGTVIEQGCIISNNTAGRWGGGVFTGSGTTLVPPTMISNSTIANNISGSLEGRGGGGVFVSGVNVTGAGIPTITNSRIVGNTATGAASGSQLGVNTPDNPQLIATNNWYGTNNPPASFFSANVASTPFLIMGVIATPATVDVGQTSTVTASITRNSNNQTGFTVPNGTPISFSAVRGTMSPTTSTFTSGTSTSTFTGTSAGAGNSTATVDNQMVAVNITVTQPTQPPAITSANSTTFVVGTAGSFSVTTTGLPTPSIARSGTLPSGVTFTDNGDGTATLAGTPAAGTGGAYPLTFTASNGVGSNAVQNFTLTVNQAPAITSANSTTFTVGSAGSFTVTKTGFPSPTLSVSGTLPGGVTFTPGTGALAGTPATGTGGTYPLTFTANNGVGSNATQNFTLTVNEAPAITSASSAAFAVGGNGSFTVTKTGFPSPTLSVSGTLPSGVTFTPATGLLGGTPAAGTGGSYPLTFTASNGVGSDATQSFTLTVNQAPAFTSANSATFIVGTNGSFTVTTSGFPAPTIMRSGDPLPPNLSFTANGDGTATLSGTPQAGTGGVYNFVFNATNGFASAGKGGSEGAPVGATQNFTLTVNEAPAITSADSATFTEGNFGSFTVTASGFPAPTFSASGTLPSGVTLSSSGVLSGTPAAGSGGAYPITITASNGVGSNAQQSFTLNVTAAVCSAPPADAISWFAAEGNAKDLLGANDGSFTGTAAYAPGKVGQAFSFAGSSFVSVPANSGSLNLTGSAVTIEGWINPTATAGAVYFGKTQSGANDYLLLLDAGQLTAIIKAGGSEKIVRGFTDYPTNSMPLIPTPGQWTHLALTYDGALIKLYANGVQVGQDTKTGNLAGSASPFNIGGRTGSLFFNGQIDEVDVYSRALGQSEIAGDLQLQPGG